MLNLIRRYGVKDERVLEAMKIIDRADFVPEEWKDVAYKDRPLPIGHGQTISQPYTVARICELLMPSTPSMLPIDQTVLEIGTGSGYQTAILAKLFVKVYSVEVVPELNLRAGEILKKLQIANCKLLIGDGKKGWMEYAPYKGIIVAANAREVPIALVDQLAHGGRIVLPVKGEMQRGVKNIDGEVEWESFGKFGFVPLV